MEATGCESRRRSRGYTNCMHAHKAVQDGSKYQTHILMIPATTYAAALDFKRAGSTWIGVLLSEKETKMLEVPHLRKFP